MAADAAKNAASAAEETAIDAASRPRKTLDRNMEA